MANILFIQIILNYFNFEKITYINVNKCQIKNAYFKCYNEAIKLYNLQ